ncbi:hypothetical protein DSECCO2_401480 [anaerobic digester metagenome]
MTKMIQVTEAGGSFLGKDEDEIILIDRDKIYKIEDARDEVGNSKITFVNNESVNVKETQIELKKLINE